MGYGFGAGVIIDFGILRGWGGGGILSSFFVF